MKLVLAEKPSVAQSIADVYKRQAQKHNCNLRRLDFQQEQGVMSSLPLAHNLIEIRRGLTTSSTAIFVPFTTQELFQSDGETLYYGLDVYKRQGEERPGEWAVHLGFYSD